MNSSFVVELFSVVVIFTILLNNAECRCTSTLRQGSRGDCVKVVQASVGTTADGIFGANTRNAVIKFQRNNGLDADGIVGPKTWTKIYGSSGSTGGGGSGSASSCGCSYDYARTDSGGPAPGARNLANYLKGKYGGRTEIYNNRNVRGGTTKSLHAEGRAVDFYGSATNMAAAFNHAKSIACTNGIQEVIYNRQIWTSSGVKAYNGANPHTDHVHVGLNKCGASKFS